jgi:hypothetical protein
VKIASADGLAAAWAAVGASEEDVAAGASAGTVSERRRWRGGSRPGRRAPRRTTPVTSSSGARAVVVGMLLPSWTTVVRGTPAVGVGATAVPPKCSATLRDGGSGAASPSATGQLAARRQRHDAAAPSWSNRRRQRGAMAERSVRVRSDRSF